MKCPIPWCTDAHLNQHEHFAAVRAEKVSNVTNGPKAVSLPPENVTNRVTNKDKDRVYKWRAANKDRYNNYMREHMRKVRATQ